MTKEQMDNDTFPSCLGFPIKLDKFPTSHQGWRRTVEALELNLRWEGERRKIFWYSYDDLEGQRE